LVYGGYEELTKRIRQIQEFVEQGAAAWKKAGQGLAELAKTVDTKTANADYLTLLEALFVRLDCISSHL